MNIFQKLDEFKAEGKRLRDQKKKLEDSEKNTSAEIVQLGERLKAKFDEFDKSMNEKVIEIVDVVKRNNPLYNIDIKFRFKYKRQTDWTEMVRLKRNRNVIGLENVSHLDQARIHWIIFAAFHQYSHAPFLFIDFTNLGKPIVRDLVGPLIKEFISKKSQMFYNCCELHQLGFANIQFGANKVKVNLNLNLV